MASGASSIKPATERNFCMILFTLNSFLKSRNILKTSAISYTLPADWLFSVSSTCLGLFSGGGGGGFSCESFTVPFLSVTRLFFAIWACDMAELVIKTAFFVRLATSVGCRVHFAAIRASGIVRTFNNVAIGWFVAFATFDALGFPIAVHRIVVASLAVIALGYAV